MAPKGYSRLQIGLHWIVVLLIAAQFVLDDAIGEAWDAVERGAEIAFNPLVAAHVFGGIAVLVLGLARLGLRFGRGVPAAPAGDPPLQRLAAHLVHVGLYALMIVVPVAGGMAWFGGIEAMAEVHEVLTSVLLAFVGLHVAGALYHQFWLKDGLLLRMKRPAD